MQKFEYTGMFSYLVGVSEVCCEMFGYTVIHTTLRIKRMHEQTSALPNINDTNEILSCSQETCK
jgi:hypothetical protein